MSDSNPPVFQIMVKPRGAVCNLNCGYCYYLAKKDLYPRSDFRMSDTTLKDFTSQLMRLNPGSHVVFAWQGGEPTLMGIDFYKAALKYQEAFRVPGMQIQNVLQTNGTTLDAAWCEFFRKQGFLIGLSVDGPARLHNAYRVDKGGRPTFNRVFHGLRLLRQHRVEFNILTCVHSKNVQHPLEVYRFLRDRAGATFIQFIPIVQQVAHDESQDKIFLHEASITGKQYGDFLIAVFDEWVRRDVGRVFVQMFDNALGKWMGAPNGLCVYNETCGEMLALEHNGDLYACDHFVDAEHKLGNIGLKSLMTLATSISQKTFGEAKQNTLSSRCKECDVRFACNGGCPKNRVDRLPGGERGLNHLCDGYQAFFRHIDGPMRMMCALLHQCRSPAMVMNIMAHDIESKAQG